MILGGLKLDGSRIEFQPWNPAHSSIGPYNLVDFTTSQVEGYEDSHCFALLPTGFNKGFAKHLVA